MENSNGDKTTTDHEGLRTTIVWAGRRDVAWAILGWGAIVAAVLWLAGHVFSTLIVLALGALLAYALAPIVGALSRAMPRWVAITLVYVGLLIVLAGVLALVVSSLISQISSVAQQITAALSPSHPGGNAPLYEALLRLGLSNGQISAMRDYATTQLATAVDGLAPLLSSVLGGVFDILVIIVLSIYFMIDGSRVKRWLHNELPLSLRHRSILVTDTVERVAGGYIRGQLILCGSIGLLVGLGLWVFGVPFAALLGMLTFFLEFIPFLGPPIAAAFAILLAWPQGFVTIGLILGWFVLIHILEGYVLQPKLVGHSIGVNATIMILAALGAGEVFGLLGALFAAPVAGVAQSLIIAFWTNWREQHPDEFPTNDSALNESSEAQTANADSQKS